MNETVFYIRGFPPFSPDHGITEAFLRDLELVSQLPEAQFDAIYRELASADGFVGHAGLVERIGRHTADLDVASRLARLVKHLGDRRKQLRHSADDLARAVQPKLSSAEPGEQPRLSEKQFGDMQKRLAKLFEPFAFLVRQAKAESLCERTGQPLERFDFICDVRPVFDQQRESVEGMIPLTTLRVVCKGIDGLPVSLEATLTQLQVDALAEGARMAQQKLKQVRKMLSGCQMQIPEIEMTRQEPIDE
jgi:hypothetical protein